MKKLFPVLFLFIFFTSRIHSQEVKNINFEVKENLINIDYVLTGSKYVQVFDVSIYVSFDSGNNFQGPLKSVSGDVGKGIKSGSNRIVWDFYKDVIALEGNIVFKIVANVKNQKHYFLHYSGNYSLRDVNFSAPFGLSFGQLGKIGWYVSARINTTSFANSDFDFNGTDIIDYDKTLYYEFDNNYKYPSLEAFGGITFHLFREVFAYGGVGYGYQKYYWHINEYDYMDNSLKDESYLDYTDYSVSGIAAEAGIIVRAKSFSFNIGYSALDFSYSNIVFGIGLNF